MLKVTHPCTLALYPMADVMSKGVPKAATKGSNNKADGSGAPSQLCSGGFPKLSIKAVRASLAMSARASSRASVHLCQATTHRDSHWRLICTLSLAGRWRELSMGGFWAQLLWPGGLLLLRILPTRGDATLRPLSLPQGDPPPVVEGGLRLHESLIYDHVDLEEGLRLSKAQGLLEEMYGCEIFTLEV
jgi:hypothetical protein